MATAKNTVEVRIRALVEGLSNVTNFGKTVRETAATITNASAEIGKGGEGLDQLAARAGRVSAELAKARQSMGPIGATIAGLRQSAIDATLAFGQQIGVLDANTKARQANTKETEKSAAAQTKSGQAAKQSSTDLLNGTQAITQFNGALGKLVGAFKLAAGGFVGFKTFQMVKDFTDAASRAETLAITLNVVGQNAGYSKQMLAGYEQELKKTGISTIAARDSLTKLIQAGINLNQVNSQGVSIAAQLARASQDLAVVTGQSSSETFQKLITNIQQLDTVGLRYQGLIIDVAAAQDKFALSLGKTAAQLTQSQKQQAVLNAVLEKASVLQGAYEQSLDSVGKMIGSLSRVAEDAAVEIGKAFLPLFRVLVKGAMDFLNAITNVAKGLSGSGGMFERAAVGIQKVVDVLGTVGGAILRAFQTADISQFLDSLSDLGTVIVDQVLKPVGDLLAAFYSLGEQDARLNPITVAFRILGVMVAGIVDAFQFMRGVVLAVSGGIGTMVGQAINGFAKLRRLMGNEGAARDIENIGQAFLDFGANATKESEKIAQSFAKGESQIAKYLKSVQDAVNAKPAADTEGVEKEATAYEKAAEKVRLLALAKTENKKSSAELASEVDALSKSLATMGENGELSAAQVAELQKKLSDLQGALSDQFNQALKNLGLTKEELAGFSSEAVKASGALLSFAEAAGTTGDQLVKAFDLNDQMAKGIQDLGLFEKAAKSALEQGRITGAQYQEIVAGLRRRFEDLTAAQLKSAKTEADFRRLSKELKALGDGSKEFGRQITQAYQRAEEASRQLGQTALDRSRQTTEVMNQQLDIAKAQTTLSKAEADTAAARAKVLQAENTYREEATEQNRALLEQARAEYNLRVEQEKLARIQLQLQVAAMQELIQSQRVLNAEKRLGVNPENTGLQREVQVQQQLLEQRQEVTENLRQNVVQQSLVVERTQQSVAEAQRLAASLQEAGDAAQNIKVQSMGGDLVRDVASGLNAIFMLNKQRVVALGEAAAAAWERAMGSLETQYRGTTRFGELAADFFHVADAIEGEFKRQEGLIQTFVNNVNAAGDSITKLQAALARAASSNEMTLLPADQIEEYNAAVDAARAKVRQLRAAQIQAAQEAKAEQEAQVRQAREALEQIRQAHIQAFRAASDSVKSAVADAASFGDSLTDLMGELQDIRIQQALNRKDLTAAEQMELEASKRKAEARANELRMEYELLRVKLLTAQAEAKAAGNLEAAADAQKALNDMSRQYEQAQRTITEIQRADEQSIRDRYQEMRAQQQEQARQEQMQRQQAAQAEAQRLAAVEPSVQSIAKAGQEATAAPGTQQVQKVVKVKLESEGQTVDATVPADQEQQLLKVLNRAKRVS